MGNMKVLVLNCGSSSVKYQLYSMPDGEVLAKGLVQRIGEREGSLEQTSVRGAVKRTEPIADHDAGLRRIFELLTQGEHAPLGSVEEIGAVGHRVVHGGERFAATTLIDDDVAAAIKAHFPLAPLHNPPNLLGIEVARSLLPKVPQVAVFDTAFHQTLPPHAYLYALPPKLYREAKVRRYGFHGTSHRYVTQRAAEMLDRPADTVNLITAHLGNGSSVTAVENGKSVDTSMGLTPLEGLVMGTRSGDIDPAIIFHLARVENMSLDDIDKLLNKKSGLVGMSGKSNDVRELLRLRDEGDQDAAMALEVCCYRLKKYVGAYLAVLGRLDALVFTAGIGENAPFIRERVCSGLSRLGIVVDPEKNQAARGREADISPAGLETRVLVVPTNEEKLIAMDTFALTAKG
ncbi:MAG: acetate kinase [Polyangiaceae bacterium]|nr:acetate kinase [Polyangiaceae bacterium]